MMMTIVVVVVMMVMMLILPGSATFKKWYIDELETRDVIWKGRGISLWICGENEKLYYVSVLSDTAMARIYKNVNIEEVINDFGCLK